MMIVGELLLQLSECDPEAIVTIGNGPGPLAVITPTVNGFVILDAGPPLTGPEQERVIERTVSAIQEIADADSGIVCGDIIDGLGRQLRAKWTEGASHGGEG